MLKLFVLVCIIKDLSRFRGFNLYLPSSPMIDRLQLMRYLDNASGWISSNWFLHRYKLTKLVRSGKVWFEIVVKLFPLKFKDFNFGKSGKCGCCVIFSKSALKVKIRRGCVSSTIKTRKHVSIPTLDALIWDRTFSIFLSSFCKRQIKVDEIWDLVRNCQQQPTKDCRVVRACASGDVDLGLIPSRVKLMTSQLLFTVSVLDVQHKRYSEKNKPASLLVLLVKALIGITPSWCDRQMANASALIAFSW